MAKRFLTWVLGAFVVMLFCCSFLPARVCAILAAVLLPVGVITLFLRFPLKQTVAACCFSLALAALVFWGSEVLTARVIDRLPPGKHTVYGQVTEIGSNSAGTLARYRVQLRRIDEEPLPFYERYSIYVYAEETKKTRVGDYLSGTVELFDSPLEFGAGKEDNVLLSAYMKQLHIISSTGFSMVRLLDNFKQMLLSRLNFGTEKTQGLLRSICFGEKDNMDPALYVSLRRIGLSHVSAVSGLHLSFTVLLFNLLLILLRLPYRVRYLIDVFIAIFFTAAVGFPPSCVRACVMLVLLSVAMAVNLFPDTLTALAVAAFWLTVWNPFVVRDLSFQLSVLATLGIITLQKPLGLLLFPEEWPGPFGFGKAIRSVTGVFTCSIAATLATLPITLTAFGSVSLIGPFANVLLILPIEALFFTGIVGVVFSWIPDIPIIAGFFSDILYRVISAVASFLGRFSLASVTTMPYTGLFLLILFAVVIAVSVYLYRQYHRRCLLALFLLFLCFCGSFRMVSFAMQEEEPVVIAFVDVGQGDCTVISKAGAAVILDYGGSSDKRYQLIDYLNAHNIYKVEVLALTHLHADHTDGLRSLLKNVYVDRILFPYTDPGQPELMTLIETQNSTEITDDSSITVLGNVELQLITKSANLTDSADDNERCICYRVVYGEISVLVTGDLEATAELQLLDQPLDCTLLKVAHHGSNTSSTYPFLKAVSPEIAVISVGENTYGLPKQEVIDRLKTLCPKLLLTEEEGTICFETDGTLLRRKEP